MWGVLPARRWNVANEKRTEILERKILPGIYIIATTPKFVLDTVRSRR